MFNFKTFLYYLYIQHDMMFVHTISNLFQLSNEQQIGPRTDDKRVHVQRPVAT